MKIDKIGIEKKNMKQTLKKNTHTHKNYKKGMETNETRKGKYSKIILKEKIMKKNPT
jgi:hypothetical protein